MSTLFSAVNDRVLVADDSGIRFDTNDRYPVLTYFDKKTVGIQGAEALDAYVLYSGGSAIQRVPTIKRSYEYKLAEQGQEYDARPDFVYARIRWSDVYGTNESYFSGSIVQFTAPGLINLGARTMGVGFAVKRDLYVTGSAIIMKVQSVAAPVVSSQISGGGGKEGSVLRGFQNDSIRSVMSNAGRTSENGKSYEIRRYEYTLDFVEVYAGNFIGGR